MIAALIALTLSIFTPLVGTDAGLITEPAPVDACAPVDVEHVTDEALAWMLDSGWTGVAGDGMEGLYAPGCSGTD